MPELSPETKVLMEEFKREFTDLVRYDNFAWVLSKNYGCEPPKDYTGLIMATFSTLKNRSKKE